MPAFDPVRQSPRVGGVRGGGDQHHPEARRFRLRSRHLAAALKLDMAEYWQPTAAGYFRRVSEEQTLAAISEACGAGAKGGFASLKKSALAEAAARKLNSLRWRPELLPAA